MSSSSIIKTLAGIALLLAIPGLILSIFPLGPFPFLLSSPALLLGAVALWMAKRAQIKSMLALVSTSIAGLALGIALIVALTSSNEVAVDAEFQQKQEQSKEDAQKELEKELESLEEDLK